ncbi:MAG: fibronectin type III domain-containing protein [Bacteroidales bacterium]|nr:fibronectin type III domain-containing protein [Bacteroidales bacterium]
MKTILLFGIGLLLAGSLKSQQVIQSQSFESESVGWGYTAAPATFSGADAIWSVVSSELPLSILPIHGQYYWGVKDLNSPSGTSSWGTLLFETVDISLFEQVGLSFYYECIGYDSGDDMKYQLILNGVPQSEVLLIDGLSNLSVSGLENISIADTVQTIALLIAWKQNGTTDYAGIDSVSLVGTPLAIQPEPSDYPENLAVTSVSPTSISLAWSIDEGEFPAAGYFIEYSTVNFSSLPIDGVPAIIDMDISDGYACQLVNTALNQFTCSNLQASTLYYIRLIPYSNGGSTINYKTDGQIPFIIQSSYILNQLFISEVADPGDAANARFIELYNASDFAINFSNSSWSLCKQTNGTSWSCISLSGDLESGKPYLIAYQAASFIENFHRTPDLISSTVVSGNGDDAYFLFYGGNYQTGELVDVFGEINLDGSNTSWDYTDARALRKLSYPEGSNNFEAAQWRISDAVAYAFNPGFYGTQFTGAVSSSWADSSNWDNGVPLPNSSVLIENDITHHPEIEDYTTIGSLTLESQVDLLGHYYLAVSDQTKIGVTLPPYSSDNDCWNLLSAPVSGMQISESDFTSGNYDFYSWSETDNLWLNQKNPGQSGEFIQFIPGKGYLTAYDTLQTRYFTGSFIQEDVQVIGLSNNNGGWHLLGNPFPASISWGSNDWELNGVSPYAYVLDESSNFYQLVFPGDNIPSRKGFWVQAAFPEAELTIPLSMTNKHFSSSLLLNPVIIITASIHEKVFQSLYLPIDEFASPSYEWSKDASFLSPLNQDIPSIYFKEGSNQLIVNTRPFPDDEIIPIMIESHQQSIINLSVTSRNMDSSLIYLFFDPLINMHYIPNDEGQIEFILPENQTFQLNLVIRRSHIPTPEVACKIVYIRINNQLIRYQIPETETILKVRLLSSDGKQVAESGKIEINAPLPGGVYYLQVYSNVNMYCSKHILY